ncbi:MAG TPA: ABC transporter ATP-binding protein [Alphaproteobacteria bacterium]|nr:ABC transporter ATP-binding protein [Alphaproteobacteria bacterium]
MSETLLELRGVTRRFGGLAATDDVSFALAPGELVGLIGPNGAGKSTLFNLIAGALLPSAGTIRFEGEDVTALPAPARCARGIARTFQVVRSFDSMSVLENVVVGALARLANPRAARHKAHEILDFVDLASRAERPAGELTMADKRRLEVARALATEPRLLLLDEVMTGLTPSEAQRGIDLVRAIRKRGIAILMVEHVMEIVMPLVDRAIVLDLGRVLASGRPDALVRDPAVIGAYLGQRRSSSVGHAPGA